MVTAEIIDLNVYSIPWDKILGIYLDPSLDPYINTICTSHMPEFVCNLWYADWRKEVG